MSKKFKRDPFFIIFANLDLITPDLYKNDTNKQRIKHIKTVVDTAKKQFPNYKGKLNMLLKDISEANVNELIKSQLIVKDLIDQLIIYPDPNLQYYSFTQKINRIFKNVTPSLRIDRGKFLIGATKTGSSFINELCFGLANFLVQGYKENVFAKCALEDCEKIILTVNGRKYCSEAHRHKVYDRKIMNDKKKKERRRADNRRNKKYNILKKIRDPQWNNKNPTFKAFLENYYPHR